MSRVRTLRRRAKICAELRAKEMHVDMLLWGYSLCLIEWRRRLPRGLMLPYWRGLPMLALTEKSCDIRTPATREIKGEWDGSKEHGGGVRTNF